MSALPQPVSPADRLGELVLSVRDLRVWYPGTKGPSQAVDGVSFDLHRGEVLGLVGESGCGKSTLGRGLLGLLPPGAAVDGQAIFEGTDLITLPPRERQALRGSGLGMIFQEPMTRLDPLMRISDHFIEAIRSHEPKLSKREAAGRATATLRSLGIPPSRFSNYPHEFSGGMRQRIMIALALVLSPRFIVADEPTTALDVLVEAQILRILAEIRRSYAPAMLLITHNLGIVAETCDRVAVMYAGRIVEQGPAEDIFESPRHPYTRELLSSTISLSTQALHSIPGSPPDLVDPPPGCRFHPRCPDAMQICRAEPPAELSDADRRVECWLSDDLSRATPDQIAPLRLRERVSVADEA